jgi:hypothetical protein
MSSFTSKNVRDLYEAYSSVYVDETELFLNELLDEVTNNINELVNEGWDFSEYSWDELYESFLDDVLDPELEKVESFITTLNESTETLSEEQIESLLQEWGWIRALTGIGQAKKAAQAVTSATGPVSRPSVLQAPLVRGSKPTPAPSAAPLEAPRTPIKPTKPLPSGLSVTGGPEKGGIITQATNLIRNLGKAKQPGPKPPAPTQPPSPKPPAGTPKPQQGQQGWPSIGLRDKVRGAVQKTSDVISKVTQKLTPGPKTKAVLKYGVLPTFTSIATPALGIDAYNLATGRPSDLQKLSGYAQGAYGNLLQTGARIGGKLGSSTAPGMFELGRQMKQAGAETQAKVETKKKSSQGTGRTGITGQIDQTTGKPVYNSYEMEGEENINEVLAYDKKTDKWYNTDSKGNKTEVTPSQTAIDRYNRLLQQRQGQGKPQSQPSATPRPPVASPKPGERKPGETTTEFHKRLRGQLPPAAPVAPATAPPAPRNDGGGTRRAPAPAPVRQPAPQASPVTQYMKAAAAARKSGDPAEMAKVRDMGLQIWASTPANKKLAAAAAERERTRGTSATTNPQMAGLKDRLPAPATTTPAAGSALAGKQTGTAFSGTALSSAKPVAAPNMSGATVTNRTPVAYKPELMKDKGSGLNPPSNTIGDTKSEVLKKGLLKKGDPGWANNARYNVQSSYEYDAYDLVLEYLISNGHADTLLEAQYVMMQMSAEHIQSIING